MIGIRPVGRRRIVPAGRKRPRAMIIGSIINRKGMKPPCGSIVTARIGAGIMADRVPVSGWR